MKLVLILFLAAFSAVYAKPSTNLDKKCSLGQFYWCQNLTTAAGCNAVKHCIQNVWEQMDVPDDNGEICQICLDMVKQARDQLQSNETQEELKQVFEGSCKLIPIKVVSKECCQLADEFIPELVETLSSQMNPKVVCSVAGLCNSASNNKLLSKYSKNSSTNKQLEDDTAPNSQKCTGCGVVISQLKENFHSKSHDQMLESFLKLCGYLSSYSDSCSTLVIENFNSIYNHIETHLLPDEVCHLAGVCADRFHLHHDSKGLEDAVEIVYESSVGFIETKPKDELTCQFCEQLVIHLRDILVANTTELEFEQVLRGLCQQTGSFKTECTNIVSEYYATLYNWLINGLKEKQVCALMGICPEPTETVKKGPLYRVQIHTGDMTQVRVIKPKPTQEMFQLPKDQLLMPQSILLGASKEECALCEYFLHFVQEELVRPSTEEQIKLLIEKTCNHFPETLKAECKSFIETYEPALVAILAQEIDPSIVCPSLGICPKSELVKEKPVCPLCLLAVESLINKLKENKTEEAIRQELEALCTSLPKSLVEECDRFVDKYEEDLIDTLIANFTSEEVCIFLKLCDNDHANPTNEPSTTTAQGFYRYNPDEDVETNEIPNYPIEKMKPNVDETSKPRDSNVCVLCEFVLSKIDNMLKDKSTEEEIKDAVDKVCKIMPKTVKDQCLKFVEQYGDLVITLLSEELDPKEVCSAIKLCQNSSSLFLEEKRALLECHICEMFLGAVEGLLTDQGIERDVAEAVSRGCSLLPTDDQQECNFLVQAYGPLIIDLVTQFVSGPMVCHKIKLCPTNMNRSKVHLIGGNACIWGPSYWCQSIHHAKKCGNGAVKHCSQRVWKKV